MPKHFLIQHLLNDFCFSFAGVEAVGEVIAVGPRITGTKVGDIVTHSGSAMGSYSEEQILPADKVFPLPSSISPVIAASVILKGMTAQYLLRHCFKVCSMCILEHIHFQVPLSGYEIVMDQKINMIQKTGFGSYFSRIPARIKWINAWTFYQ